MKLILYGATDIAYLIASNLHTSHLITIIDEASILPQKFESLDVNFVTLGDGRRNSFESLGIVDADLFIACLGLYEANIVSCIMVKRTLKIPTLCFVSNPSRYTGFLLTRDEYSLTQVGIDNVIWSEESMVRDIVKIIILPEALDFEYLYYGRAGMVEYKLHSDFKLLGQSLRQAVFPDSVLVVGVFRNDELFIPSGDTIMQEGDKLIFMGLESSLTMLSRKYFVSQSDRVDTVTIAGGGNVGYMLARRLEELKVKVKVIEQSSERAKQIAEQLKHSIVLNNNATDAKLFQQEEISQSDVFIAVTHNDETNLLLSMMAKQAAVPKVLSRVSNEDRALLFERAGVDVTFSAARSIMNELRSKYLDQSSSVIAVVENGKGNVMEFTVGEYLDKTALKDIDLKNKAIVALLKRGNRIIIPTGKTVLRRGDELKIFSLEEYAAEIGRIFSK